MKFSSTIIALLFGLLFQIPNFAFAQDVTPVDIALRYLESNKEALQLTSEDIQEYQVSDLYTSQHNGVTHVYLNQTHQKTKVNNAIFNINILPNGKVLNHGNRFVSNLKEKINTTIPTISAADAVRKVIERFEIKTNGEIRVASKTTNNNYTFSPEGLAMEPIPVDLVYEVLDNKTVKLAWMVRFYQLDAKHWWNARIDATSGEVLTHDDQMLHCNFSESKAACTEHAHNHNFVKSEVPLAKPAENILRANSYNVYEMPVQSPSFGDRSLVTDPADSNASPFGWHDTDGEAGAEYTITRGNNVHAYQDVFDINASSGDEPDGGATLDFDFPLDLSANKPYTQIDPAVVNLFYWNNMMHDVWYQYGFDEVAGNFQVNNYDKGGEDGDHIRAEALDGSATNNAVFGTDADGSGARIQMFLWSNENLPGPPPTPDLIVTMPDTISGQEVGHVPGGFGGSLPVPGVTARVVLASDSTDVHSDLCEDVTNAAELEGNIAMIDRGDCQFGVKMLKAERAGAIAVIMCNNEGGNPIEMAPGTDGAQVTIPGVMITMDDCIELKMHLSDGLMITMEGSELIIPSPGPGGVDGDLDNGVIAHEYGHGLSIRMTGGPSTGNCLRSDEQAGEGWSDWFAMVMTTNSDNTAEERRGLATYAVGQPTTGRGLRTYPYSRDMSINPDTYREVVGEGVHRVGSVWCAMTWDLFWNMVDEYTFDDDIYNGSGGNNMAMQLVIDGIKLQPCNPDFIDSRDAIIAADEANYGGANKCLIWETFARRGLGFSATSGGNEAFDLPPDCQMVSTSNVELYLGVSISPNPTDGIFTVKINDTVTDDVNIRVTNVAGSLLFSKQMNAGTGALEFDLSDYQAGVYLLQIQTEEASVIRKVVVN